MQVLFLSGSHFLHLKIREGTLALTLLLHEMSQNGCGMSEPWVHTPGQQSPVQLIEVTATRSGRRRVDEHAIMVTANPHYITMF